MKTLNIKEVVLTNNRIRREFDQKALEDLRDSIDNKGLFNAPVLKNNSLELCQGERRLRACSMLIELGKSIKYNGMELPLGHIPVTYLGDLSEDQVLEAELEENTRRRDLTIQEHAQAVSRLHKLRTKQHGEYDRSTQEGWNVTKTAGELAGRAPRKNEISDVSVDLLIADNLDDPFVAAAADRKEALKAIRERHKTEKRNKLLATSDTSKSRHTLLKGNCYDLAQQFPGKFDVIVTDPPYGIDAHKIEFWDGESHEYDDSDEAFAEVLEKLPTLALACTKPQAHIYIFCDIRRFNELFVAFEIAGWNVWSRPLIWHKGNAGSFGNIEFGFRQTYDAILFANKGKKPMTAGYTDVISMQQKTGLPHPAGKPWELYAEILKRSVYPGDEVADFYCGHGPIFRAAEENHCIATGIEQSDKYFPMAQESLVKLKEE